MLAEILTLDNLLHAIAAALLIFLLAKLGAFGLPTAVALIFLAREMEQAAAKGERWTPWLWSWHRHAEYLVPAIVGFLTFGLI